MDFFSSAVDSLGTVVTLIGAGIGAWGIFGLLEAYSSDNPGQKAQGIKQLMAGGGVILLGQVLVPQLSSLMSTGSGGSAS